MSREALDQLIQQWRQSATAHEARADAAARDGDAVNFNRQDAYAYAARLHANQLAAIRYDEWLRQKADLEEGHDVTAGSESGFTESAALAVPPPQEGPDTPHD